MASRKSQEAYARDIVAELMAEYAAGHHQETTAVIWAKHWIELEMRAAVSSPSGETVRGK